MPNDTQRRRFYRLRYPAKERPTAKLMGKKFSVCEISEQGIRILFDDILAFSPGAHVNGVIRFHDGEVVSLEGYALRLDRDELVIQLIAGPSLKRMTKEQLYIRKHYPGFFQTQHQK